MPIQSPPPIWVVSNPRLKGDAPPDVIARRLEAACRRIVEYGDGWMTCCRAQHPEELVEQLGAIERYADEHGADFSRLVISYQVTMNIGDSEEEARARLRRLHLEVLPGAVARRWTCRTGARSAPRTRSPSGSATFAEAGVDHFICRFGAIDQFGQVERFAKEVLPVFSAERVR